MSKSFGKGKGKGGGLKVFWLPTGHKSHKHKKNKYYVHDDSPKSAMMSGDSPNSHGKDFFDFKDGRSTPPPTTSKDTAVQSGSGITDPKTDVVAASVLAEPPKEHGPGTNKLGVIDGHTDKNDDEILATEDKPLKADDRPDGGDKHDKTDAPKKINGTIDKLDGNWVNSPEMKKEEEEQDDTCAEAVPSPTELTYYKMYNVKGPSKIVAKTTRRGIAQNIDSFRDSSKNMKSLDANDNEIVNGPKPVFHNNSRRIPSNHPRQQEVMTPQHEELIKYIHDSWLTVSSDVEEAAAHSNTNKNRRGSNRSVKYYEDAPCPHLQDFKPFDLESWWGKRLYSLITNSVNGKN